MQPRPRREAIQINVETLSKITDRFPSIDRNYTREELLDLARKCEYVVTNPEPLIDFWIITEQDFLMNYGTASRDIEHKFVPVVKVLQ